MNYLEYIVMTPVQSHDVTGETEYFELKVTVDFDTAPSLTVGRENIEDILVLHLEGGKDFFVSFHSNKCT